MKRIGTLMFFALLTISACTKPAADKLYQCKDYPNIRYLKIEFEDSKYSHYQYMTFDMIYKDISKKLYPSGYDCAVEKGSLYCTNADAKINKYLLIRSFESFFIQVSTDSDSAKDNLDKALNKIIKKLI